jgi:hypothetical protein
MEITMGIKQLPLDEHALQEAERCRLRYLTLVEALRATAGNGVLVPDVSLRHSEAQSTEYQQIMRLIVRPIGTSNSRSRYPGDTSKQT